MFISFQQAAPLHVAAYRDNVEAITFLVDKGADVNIKDNREVSTSIDNMPMEKGLEMREKFCLGTCYCHVIHWQVCPTYVHV